MQLVFGLLPDVEKALQRYGVEHLTLVEPRKEKYARSLGDPKSILACANPADPEVALATLMHAGIDPATIDLVWGTGEFTVVSAALVAAVLGRPSRLHSWEALGFRDKWLQKQRIAEAGIPTARRHLIQSLDDLSEAAVKVGFPAVVKPLAGAATTLTFRVEDEVQLREATCRILEGKTGNPITRYGAVLMEEYVKGDEFHLDGCLFDGEVPTLSLSWYLDNNLEVLRRGDPCSAVLLDPADVPDLYREASTFAHKALHALGLRTGFFHMEAFRTPEGFQFSECAARPGGNGVTECYRYKFGIDLFDEHVRSLIGFEPTSAHMASGVYCRTFLGAPAGVVVSMPTMEDLLVQPGVLEATLDVAVGEPVPDMRVNTSARPASAIVQSNTLDDLLVRLDELKTWFHASVKIELPTESGAGSIEDPMKGAGEKVLEMLRGHTVTQLVASAARLDLYGILDTGVHHPQEVGRRVGIHETVVSRYLAALEALGLVQTSEGGIVATEALALLDKRSGQLYGQAVLSGDPYYRAWGDLDYALATGKSAFEHAIGHGLWEEFLHHPDSAEHFTRTMGQNMSRVSAEILRRYRFPESGTLVDLGAGDGTLAMEVLRARPKLKAVMVEQASVFPSLQRAASKSNVADRCTTILGDIFEEIPCAGDLYLMKSVLHNWGDADVIRILKNCRQAMAPESRLLLIERVILPQTSRESAIRDLVMLVLFGSGDRSLVDLERLLKMAGFQVTSVDENPSGLFLIEAQVRGTGV